MKRITQKHLDKLLAVWQRRLRLQDWRIKATFVHAYELTDPGAVAEVDGSMHKRVATIKITHLSETGTSYPTNLDIEDSLVHEMLHLLLDNTGFRPERGTLQYIGMEQMIETLAGALVAGYRGTR